MALDYKIEMAAQKRPAKRPEFYADLLLHPVATDPTDGSGCYDDWEFDHGSMQRFYVGGMRWYFRQTGLNANVLAGFRRDALRQVKKRTDWGSMPNSNQMWKQDIARPQFNVAARGDPLFFQKAAIILMACELALEEALEEGEEVKDIKKPEDIYQKMSIIPACWNVNDFNIGFYEKLRKAEPDVPGKLQNAAAQESASVFEHLSNGNTVTFETAKAVKAEIDGNCGPDFNVGNVRAKPGVKRLGKQKASEFETIDRG